jgi:hypothetical protein
VGTIVAIVVGVVVGFIVLMIVLIIIVILVLRSRKKQDQGNHADNQVSMVGLVM